MKSLVLLAALIATPALAAPFDYLIITPSDQSDATAMSDPVIGLLNPTQTTGAWRADICIPNVQRWNTTQDTQSAPDGNGNTYTIHALMPGWGMVCAFQTRQPALEAEPTTYLVTDRGAAQAGQPFVVQSILPLASLTAMMLQPVFAGSAYEFGNAALIQPGP